MLVLGAKTSSLLVAELGGSVHQIHRVPSRLLVFLVFLCR